MRAKREGFRCACCGKWHDYAPTDFGFQMPDDAWALPPDERANRVLADSDFCSIDRKRWFIRCVAMVPFTLGEGYFGWGLWAEVSKRAFFRYYDHHDEKGEELASFPGTVANALPAYGALVGKPVIVKPGPKSQRPTLLFPPVARHRLALEQRSGIDASRHHEILHENMPGAVD